MTKIENLEEQILAHVLHENYRPVKPKAILKQLGLPDEARHDVRKAIKRLVRKEKLAFGERHLVIRPLTVAGDSSAAAAETTATESTAPPGRSSPAPANKRKIGDRDQCITGRFRRNANGYGFVRPSTSIGGDRTHAVYITARDALDAASGDTVLVRLSKKRSPRGPSGAIVEIVDRATHQYVGTYAETGGAAYVQVDGKVFGHPILVGDAGAKNARVGDKVVVEMVHFPSHHSDGEAVITEVLGPRGTPGVDTLSIIREFGLPGPFPDDVIDDAHAQAEKFDESITGVRLDLTGETIITIDPFDARDFDDAISLERIENNHWRLGVHIADVSHFVPLKTPLDREARERATSVYLPDRVIPMLPEIISNNLASLQPDRVRYTKTAFIEFTAEGAHVATEVHSAAIRSKHRFNYEEIDEYLADRNPWRKKLTPEVFDLVGRMHELAMILRRRRFEQGAIELTMSEVKLELDDEGKVSGAHVAENTESHQIIEEFMLAANEAVATLLAEREWAFLRRVHENPDPRKLQILNGFVAELGIEAESLESRFEIQRVLDLVQGKPQEHAVNYAVLRSMQKAIYSPKDEGHFALAKDRYCHFTSPIRRYPDLTIHRLIDALIADKKPPQDIEALFVLGEHCSDREQRAEAAERELIKLKLLTYFSDRIGEEMDAVLTGVEDFGLFAQGLSLPVEGFIHVQSLQDDTYQFDRNTHSLTGRREGNSFRLGDTIRVAIARVDLERRELDLRLVGRGKSGTAPSAAARGPARRDKAGGRRAGGSSASSRGGKSQRSASGGGKPPVGKGSSGKKKKSKKADSTAPKKSRRKKSGG